MPDSGMKGRGGELEKISGETKGLRDIKAVNGEALDP